MVNRRKASLIAVALLGALILGLAITPLLFRERKYEGRTIREWIYALDPHVDARKQHDEASEVIVRIGRDCIPVISSILSEPKQRGMAERIRMLARKLGVMPREELPLSERKYRASRAAYKIAESAGVDISSLVPLLAHHLTNSIYGDSESSRALANAGPPGVAALTNLASHVDSRIRQTVLFSLQHARNKPGVFETYLRARNDPDEHVRHFALSSLARYRNADAALLLPIGLESAQSTNKYDRWAAMYILMLYKTNHLAEATLSNALTDPDPNVSAVARRVLE